MKKVICCSLLFLSLIGYSQSPEKAYPGSYYITNKGDTVKTTLLYTDLFIIQHSIMSVDQNGIKTRLDPNEIKSFCINVSGNPDGLDYYCNVFSHEWIELRKELAGFSKISCFVGAIDSLKRGKFYSDLYYESVLINDKHIFIHRLFEKSNVLKLYTYYYPYYSGKLVFKTVECYNFIMKDDQVVQPKRKFRKLLAGLTQDYTLLSKMILEKKMYANTPRMNNSFPDLELVFNEYDRWKASGSVNPMDTPLVMRGIIEANRYYKPRGTYIQSAAVSSLFVLPGFIYAELVLNHPPKFKDLNIPLNCTYCNNEDYLKGYKMRAMYKKSRAIVRGIITGGIITYGVLLPLIVITNS